MACKGDLLTAVAHLAREGGETMASQYKRCAAKKVAPMREFISGCSQSPGFLLWHYSSPGMKPGAAQTPIALWPFHWSRGMPCNQPKARDRQACPVRTPSPGPRNDPGTARGLGRAKNYAPYRCAPSSQGWHK